MNIFVLDIDPAIAAGMLCDAHVVKMTTESVQIMSTIARRVGVSAGYKATHGRHPCVLWAGEARGNWTWLTQHARALCAEYERRYARTHGSVAAFHAVDAEAVAYALPDGRTPFVLCMPEQYHGPDAVESYRRYYAGEKVWQKRADGRRVRLARWERGMAAPQWWGETTECAVEPGAGDRAAEDACSRS